MWKVFTIIIACVVTFVARGANNEKTLLLHDMANALKLNTKALPNDSIIETDSPVTGKKIIVKTDSTGVVTNIGYPVIDNILWNNKSQKQLYDFIERYLLQLDLKLKDFSAGKRLSLDKIQIIAGDPFQLQFITRETPLTIGNYDWKSIVFTWKLPNGELIMEVPADRELILGATSPELEDIFIRSLSSYKSQRPKNLKETILEWGYNYPASDNIDNKIIKIEGNPFLSDMIRSDITLFSSTEGESIYINPASPAQSVSNIMITGDFNKNIPLNLTVDKYGYKKESLNTSLNDFLNYCRNEEGCEIFFGIKKINEDTLTGTLFAVNKLLAYNHVLSLEFPLKILRGEDGAINGTIYTYVPLQNMYDEFFYKDISTIPNKN